MTLLITVDRWNHGGPGGEAAGPKATQQGQKTGPSDSCFPFSKGEQSGKPHPSCGFQMTCCRSLTSLLSSGSIPVF